ncbi:MAG: ribonuclease R [Candidatus Gracilibacteria bacterium]|nr:ribonuclease R [Candidatus Gracilibacteria bacterium]
MKKAVGIFQEAKGFGFVVPSDKSLHSGDFFIPGPFINGASNGDLVEVEISDKLGGKNREAKIVGIVKLSTEHKANEANVIGVYSQGNGDFGFVDVETETPTGKTKKGYFVFGRNKKTAMNGDLVEASVKVFKGKEEAEIVRVIERKKGLIVGTYTVGRESFGFVVPKNETTIKSDIFVASTNAMGAHNGDIVGVEITKFGKKSPEGVIKEIIAKKGSLDKREEEILTIAVEAGAKITFPDEVQNQLSSIGENVDEKEIARRKDFRDLFTFTIDGADAKDLDDAISLEKLDNGDYKLYVHIADVTNYVTENSALDKEALERGTSIYLADRVIPMLPEKLSNNLCSLNPYTDKLTLTCEMHIGGKTGHLIKSKVWESVIRSDYRLTYKDVDNIDQKHLNVGDELMFRGETTLELLETIKSCNDLKEIILKYREQTGTLDFDFPETVVDFDADGNPIGIKEYPKYDSNKLIEVFMVSANEAVAKEYSRFPFLYRIHEIPKENDIVDLQDKLNLFGIKFKFKENTTAEFGQLIEKFSDLPDTKRRFLERMTLRTLTQASYSHINFGHFGLGLEFYSHFTSPIRRYPDLQIHRIIKESLNSKLDPTRQAHYKSILPKVGTNSSERERLSDKLEYKVRDYFVVKYYKDKVGQEFDAIISGTIYKGFFVELPDTAEGFVEIDGTHYDEKLQTHRDKLGNKFTLGDSVRVKLVEADEKMLRLNFEVVK